MVDLCLIQAEPRRLLRKREKDMTYDKKFYTPPGGQPYEIITPERVLTLSLADIDDLPPAMRAWLTRVYRGLPDFEPDVQAAYAGAREHLFRIGYRPASEPTPPTRKARRSRQSY
jgi:hypothetical protein